jgi:hypothetical protein
VRLAHFERAYKAITLACMSSDAEQSNRMRSVTIRMQPKLYELIVQASASELLEPSHWMRRAALRDLQRDDTEVAA